jgi:hypothetical protein
LGPLSENAELKAQSVEPANFVAVEAVLFRSLISCDDHVGKLAATSSATQHGGNETTSFLIVANLLHFGMVSVGCPIAMPDK